MCGATSDSVSLDGIDLNAQPVIQGVVSRDHAPLSGAYVRLLAASDEFVAELPTSATGQSGVFASPGERMIRTRPPRAPTTVRMAGAIQGVVAVLHVCI